MYVSSRSSSWLLTAALVGYFTSLSSGAGGGLDAAATHNDGAAPDAGPVQCSSASQCAHLGEAYAEAKGVPRDFERAAQYFQIGCETGDIGSCLGAAQIRKVGMGAKRDEALALRLFLRVCDSGDQTACRFAGEMYETGSRTPGVVAKDEPKAAQVYDRACKNGEGPACSRLASMYEAGRGVKKDKRRAASLQKEGARLGFDPRE
jgi:uncharacterized protein